MFKCKQCGADTTTEHACSRCGTVDEATVDIPFVYCVKCGKGQPDIGCGAKCVECGNDLPWIDATGRIRTD